jgi:hypothetical protein
MRILQRACDEESGARAGAITVQISPNSTWQNASTRASRPIHVLLSQDRFTHRKIVERTLSLHRFEGTVPCLQEALGVPPHEFAVKEGLMPIHKRALRLSRPHA